ncbi:MAG: hypothetical protein AAB622_02260 [Patescibacteria group bacterium]
MIEDKDKLIKASFYENQAKECFSKHSGVFTEFVSEPDAVVEGDYLISSGLARGYNFAKKEDFPLKSKDPVIIYNNYIQRTSHFGEVLAAMDREGLIYNDNYHFGVKASKVLGSWDDEEPKITKITKFGKEVDVSESVEGCLILKPSNVDEALNMIKFLETRTRKADDITFIKGSWTIPDIRSSKSLEEALAIVGYKAVYANTLNINGSDLITLKRSDKIIKEGWENQRILVNSSLYDFVD